MVGICNTIMKDENLRKTFGKRLRDLRNQSRLSQKELAKKLGLKLSIFTKYEMGLHLPPPEKLIELSELFTTTVDFLLTGNSSEEAPLHNRRLIERLKDIQKFQAEDQEIVIRLIDALIVKNRAESLLVLPQ